MKYLFVNSSFNFINKHQNLDHYNQVKIKYGLEVLYHFVTKTIVIFFVSYLLHLLKYTLLLFIFYGPIRMFGHGLHAKSNKWCWINSLSVYLILDLYLKYTNFNFTILIILLFISLFSIVLWAPADTKNEPLVNKKTRKKLKIKSIIIGIAYCIIFMITKYSILQKIICFSLLLESVLINPFIYYITKSKYKNYLDYR